MAYISYPLFKGGDSWLWSGGEAPTVTENSVLALYWCNDTGIANLIEGGKPFTYTIYIMNYTDNLGSGSKVTFESDVGDTVTVNFGSNIQPITIEGKYLKKLSYNIESTNDVSLYFDNENPPDASMSEGTWTYFYDSRLADLSGSGEVLLNYSSESTNEYGDHLTPGGTYYFNWRLD